MTESAASLKNLDKHHELEMKKIMHAIELENDDYKQFVMRFNEEKNDRITKLQELKIAEKHKFDSLESFNYQTEKKKREMIESANKMCTEIKVSFEKLDFQKKDLKQSKLYSGSTSRMHTPSVCSRPKTRETAQSNDNEKETDRNFGMGII
eukprot:CAMPEP_0116892618 /NCGR_PEP_ID=MMETSP0467-20121206/2797_1 /TAXON_ID=283647 /ORGANISM="Mesodinium pulex, Strain SPMC105" /LENGTH=150 /DNA_ID=CAMNT_0004561839 /DNA_START=1506 /DNA_END=1958 /DNA_ORIENTATION=+